MESFDVVIIGAGPGGLKCAETFGNSKYKVLLLEKNFIVGPKVCAGGLTGKGIYQAMISGEEVARKILDKNYKSELINDLLETKKKHNKILNLLNSWGKYRSILYYLGLVLLKIPYYRKKIINFLG